jgi:hypothetical protein
MVICCICHAEKYRDWQYDALGIILSLISDLLICSTAPLFYCCVVLFVEYSRYLLVSCAGNIGVIVVWCNVSQPVSQVAKRYFFFFFFPMAR